MNQYETVLIFTPVLSSEEVKQRIGEYKSFMESKGCNFIHEDFWGMKQLAYPIKKKTTGIYLVLEFTSPGEGIENFELQFKRDENILRFLTTRLDKYAVKYNEDRRNGLIGRKRKKQKQDS